MTLQEFLIKLMKKSKWKIEAPRLDLHWGKAYKYVPGRGLEIIKLEQVEE